MLTCVRPIYAVACEIAADWKKPYFGAVPYLDAMKSIGTIDEMYGADTAKSVVLYFLSNAATYRGDTARRLKTELKRMAGVK